MLRFKRLFNFFFLIGVCPFFIKNSDMVSVPWTCSAAAGIRVMALYGIYAYIGFPFLLLFQNLRIDVSLLTTSMNLILLPIDFLILQLLLIWSREAQAKLLIQLIAIKKMIKRITRNGQYEEFSKLNRSWKRAQIEAIIKSIYYFFIPFIIPRFTSDLNIIILATSILAMFYIVLFQFIHNRLFLTILIEAIDRYLIWIGGPNPKLSPTTMVHVIRQLHDAITSYNRTFKYHNMVLIQCGFTVLLMMAYLMTISSTKFGVLVSLLFSPVFLQVLHDVGHLIWNCNAIIEKIKEIKRIHSGQLKIDQKAPTV